MSNSGFSAEEGSARVLVAARTLLAEGRFYDAEVLLLDALKSSPNDPNLYLCLGVAQIDQKRHRDGESNIRKAIAVDPTLPNAQFALGSCLANSKEYGLAISHFRLALQEAPSDVKVHIALADALDHVYEFEQAIIHAECAVEQDPSDVSASVVLARCLRHVDRPKDALVVLDHLQTVGGNKLIGALAKSYAYNVERAFCLLDLEEVDTALPYTAKVSLALKEANPNWSGMKTEGQKVMWAERAHAQELAGRIKAGKPPVPYLFPKRQVFMCGFPRSGTTLMRSVLSSHPKLAVVQESPALEKAVQTVPPNQLSQSGLEQSFPKARDIYFESVRERITTLSGRVLVDIHPMNTPLISWMAELFPHAQLVLVVRHPCDVCLSAYMQAFEINDYTAGMLTLEDTVDTYSQMMSLWNDTTQLLGLQVLTVRYEDVIADFKSEIARVLEHIGVDWDANVEAFASTAKTDRPATASSHQVIKPLYEHASYRWERCRKIIEPHFDQLAPFIEAYGYSFD